VYRNETAYSAQDEVKNMLNANLTDIRKFGPTSLRERCGAYVETGVTDPFFTGVVVFVVTSGLSGTSNFMAYLKKKKAGKEAISDTFKTSTKAGVFTVFGIAAGNAVAGTGLVLVTSSVLPIVAGVTSSYLLKRFWDKAVARNKESAPGSAPATA
jgi:ABC-type thiamin/hydroxymethylpyrimidine transport system permease subunit